MLSLDQWQSDPPRGQGEPKFAVREKRDVPVHRADMLD